MNSNKKVYRLSSRIRVVFPLVIILTILGLFLQNGADAQLPADTQAQIEAKAKQWVGSLNLKDPVKDAKVTNIIVHHLDAVYTWHAEHPFTTVPAGINPQTGNKLTELDRSVIAQSAMPDSIHKNLMEGLRENLNADQVEMILDKYTIGKVAFTWKGYQAIVPNLTAAETATILTNLKLAREQAVDYKSMKAISTIFKIYKTKNEQYLDQHGRNWRQLFKNYVDAVKAQKAAAKAQKGK